MSQPLYRILSIDGGGIRGIIPGQILIALEDKLQQATGNPNARIADFFDLIAGTSTGGILTCMYACPDKNGRPKFSAKDAVALYLQHGSQIFSAHFSHKLKSIWGLRRSTYPVGYLEKLLLEYLGDIKLSDALTNILVSAFNVDESDTFFFTSSDAKEKNRDFYLREVARCTSAAPTYFEPAFAGALTGSLQGYVDGAVYANNPAMCALVEAYKIDVNLHRKYRIETRGIGSLTGNHSALENIFMLSLGNSNYEKSFDAQKVKKYGAIDWILPVLEMMMEGVSETVAYQAEQLFRLLRIEQIENELDRLDGSSIEGKARQKTLFNMLSICNTSGSYRKQGETILNTAPYPQYIRINPTVEPAKGALDNASAENLDLLKVAGENAAKKYDEHLNVVVELLLQGR